MQRTRASLLIRQILWMVVFVGQCGFVLSLGPDLFSRHLSSLFRHGTSTEIAPLELPSEASER